ncbi:MAG TPA: mechanosensitive ion channel family protein [Syntrophomonadaceae bacterium]|nr:mechanosensitive ion channel family protein [Syntrophomonadaceae bacterium]
MQLLQEFFRQNYDLTMLILICLAIFFAFYIAGILVARYLVTFIGRVVSKSRIDLDQHLLNAFEMPLRTLFVVLGVYYTLCYLDLPAQYDVVLVKILRSFIVLVIAWGIYRLAGTKAFLTEELVDRMEMDQILVPLISKVIQIAIIALSVILIANEWDYDVNGFIAGLGLGGLAFALAAQDMLANLFGGIVIVMEKPFSLGDWVYTPSVEGTVEDISFRSTRFRTFAQALVTVPNSTLAREAITNWSRMGKRRLDFHLRLSVKSTADQMKTVVKSIEEMLRDHPGIHPETIMVYLETIHPGSLDVFVYCFTSTTVWDEYLAVREDVNFKIMEILDAAGVSMAFPSQNLVVENL